MHGTILRQVLAAFILVVAVAGSAAAGVVGGQVYPSPGTIMLRPGVGVEFSECQGYKRHRRRRLRVRRQPPQRHGYGIVGKFAPAGKGKQIAKYIIPDAATQTHVYCRSSSSAGVRVAAWNRE